MPKKPNPKNLEQKQFYVYNPEDVKHTTNIPAKPKPKLKDLQKIEKKGKTKPKKSRKKQKKGEYILIITEKPQAASKISAALSNGNDRRKSPSKGVYYYELERNNKSIVVACAVGHLFSISQNVKGSYYPIFDISWYPNYKVRKKDFTKKYYNVIKKLVKKADEIVIATDFDREGEVIGYNILRFLAKMPDAKRMKFSSLTAPEIQSSYDNSKPTIEWGQAIAGETRHLLDWLYGINLSRALMNSIKKTGKFKIMSIGRVQGPALKLIVDRERKIQAFKPKPYWQVFITINDKTKKAELKHNKDITKKENLEKFKKLKNKKADAKTKKKKQTIKPPAPFSLTTLQTEAYKFHSITPSRALQIAQKLYLAGIISYPRTSSQKIPESMEPQKILKKLERNFSDLTKNTTRKKPVEGKKSDPAHPSITPTGNYLRLEGQDKKLYDLIVKRFISCFCDNAELENKRIEVKINNLKFVTKGTEIKKPGWMNVYPAKIKEKQIKDFNGPVTIEKVRTEEKETKPPKRYTPASIVTELEKRSLGTKATRSSIIDTLYNRQYIKDKSIKATALGIHLIKTLEKYSPIIIEEQLTQEMEKDMDKIRESKKELDEKQDKIIKKAENALKKISEDFKKQEEKIGKELYQANEKLWKQQKEDNKLGMTCPLCKKGELTLKYSPKFKTRFVACTNYPNCKQTFPLPRGKIKQTDKKCKECQWPMLMRLKQGKRPWLFCFNPNCPSRIDNNKTNKQEKNK